MAVVVDFICFFTVCFRATLASLGFLCLVGTLYGVYVDSRKKSKRDYDLPSLTKVNGHANGGFVGDAETKIDLDKGSDVNGAPTNGMVANVDGGKGKTFDNVAFVGGPGVQNGGAGAVNGQTVSHRQPPASKEEGECQSLLL